MNIFPYLPLKKGIARSIIANEVIVVNRKGISQETLKLIACVTMLLDHIGAMFVRGYTLRIIGRIAFPIYCFLMAEGAYYTKNPAKYAMRLAIGLLLSEIPFDLALKRGLTWEYQSVMFTMLIGFAALEIVLQSKHDWLSLLTIASACLLAETLHTDYGGFGVLLIVAFGVLRGRFWLQATALAAISFLMNSARIPFFGTYIAIELFAVFAMVPIALYSGKKAFSGKVDRHLQWAFYMFYPAHLFILYLVRLLRK